MKTQANKSQYLLLLIAGIAVILFSSAGIARIMGWNSTSTDGAGDVLAPDQLPAVKVRCAECGVFVSMREIEARSEGTGLVAIGGAVAGNQDETRLKSTRSYEITARFADGSSHVINDANPASWRPGERLIVIDGVDQSNRSNPSLIAQRP